VFLAGFTYKTSVSHDYIRLLLRAEISSPKDKWEMSTGIHGRSLICASSSLTDAQLSLTLILGLSNLAGSRLLAEFKGCYFAFASCESSPIPNILNR